MFILFFIFGPCAVCQHVWKKMHHGTCLSPSAEEEELKTTHKSSSSFTFPPPPTLSKEWAEEGGNSGRRGTKRDLFPLSISPSLHLSNYRAPVRNRFQSTPPPRKEEQKGEREREGGAKIPTSSIWNIGGVAACAFARVQLMRGIVGPPPLPHPFYEMGPTPQSPPCE